MFQANDRVTGKHNGKVYTGKIVAVQNYRSEGNKLVTISFDVPLEIRKGFVATGIAIHIDPSGILVSDNPKDYLRKA